MADRVDEMSFFRNIYVRIDIRIDISISIRPMSLIWQKHTSKGVDC